jgi:hypothetical protein
MAIAAISDRGEFAAAIDEIGIERLPPRRINRSNRWPPNDGKDCSCTGNQDAGDDTCDNSRRPFHPSRLQLFPSD